MRRFLPGVVLSVLLLAGCEEEVSLEEPEPPVDQGAADAKPASVSVLSGMTIPAQPWQNDALGFDLDHDSRHSIDNKLGLIIQLATDSVAGFDDPQGHVDREIASGNMVTLAILRSQGRGADEDDVSLELVPGVRDAAGLRVAPDAPQGMRVYGHIRSGRLVGREPGTASIKLALLDSLPVDVRLIGVAVDAQVDAAGVFEMKLGGGIETSFADQHLLPSLYLLIRAAAATDAGLMQLFDTNKDGTMTETEFIQSNTTRTVASPDLDLVGQDQKKDSISAGVRMTFRPAVL